MPERISATIHQVGPPGTTDAPTEAETVVQRPGGALAVAIRAAELTNGPQRIGEYEAQKKLGEGGMGVVYQGWDTQLRRNVAIKVLLPHYSVDRSAREQFLREARAAASVAHDNVVTIFHVGDHQGAAYLVMPLLKGQSLETYLRRKRTPTVTQTLRIGREIAAGLAAAHKQGLIHRDVKPGNVWLEAPQGRVKILDFGIAKSVSSSKVTAVTDDGVVLGTPAYMSPEQARGQNIDPRSDLFSLGAVLYRMCTGLPPFVRATPMDTLTALVSEDATPLAEHNSAVPPRLAALVHRLLAREPAGRPAAADEVVKELRSIERELSNDTAASGIISAGAAVRVAPTESVIGLSGIREPNESVIGLSGIRESNGFGFEVVNDPPPDQPSETGKTTNAWVKSRPTAGRNALAVGVIACLVGIVVGAVVIGLLVYTAGGSTKPKEKAPSAVNLPRVTPPATVVPAVKPTKEETKPEEKQPPSPEQQSREPDDRRHPPPPHHPPHGFPPPHRGFPPPPPPPPPYERP
ncbi:serine/threonine-protein kinase [Limnoglobus roseus]|uniref:non-specific serine/threonine protein kinase n=1 Tax=Limnoglobus roseus TaxID=2598579 RepID=A0A5C1ANS3_9BACT|nr:serine/threonine-protein kinase [Limnoglobus roseus]QEL21049.1 serine/threonine protein kinase PknB [Limnoglobus roseus]